MATTTLPAPGYAVDPATGAPVATLFPPQLRLLTPFLNITGAFALILGAVFSTYVFMPKRRVLAYSLDPNQPGDQFLFNLLIAPVAIIVNLVASLPGAVRALLAGRLHSRVPATILIAIGAFIPTLGDTLNRFGMTEWFQLGKFLGVLFLFAGFLVSIEVFREIRIPFTSIRLGRTRHEPAGAEALAEPPTRRDGPDATDEHHGVRGPPEARPRLQPAAGRHGPAAGIGPTMVADACPDRPPVAGFAVVIVAASLFGTLGPLSRFAYDAGMEPLPFVAWRGADRACSARPSSSPGGSGAAPMRLTRLGDLDRGARLSLAVAALLGFTLNLAMFIAFDLVTVALALLGFYTYPVDRRGRQRRARARDARPAADRRPRPGRRRDGRGRRLAARSVGRDPRSTRSGSAWPSARRSARPSSWSSAGRLPAVPAAQAMAVVLATTVVCSLASSRSLTGAGAALAYPLRDPSVLPLLASPGCSRRPSRRSCS